jgi:hypothetical protein
MRDWSEIYPQLCIFFSEIMEKYTKWEFRLEVVYAVYFTGSIFYNTWSLCVIIFF